MAEKRTSSPGPGDALIAVDVQNDFLPGGALAVPRGDEVIPVMNRYIELFRSRGLPIFATRDWHPEHHCSFDERGGPWPRHCVADTHGAQFGPGLALPVTASVITKGTALDLDAYSGFQGTDLAERLRKLGVARVFVGGLATDYCVLNTVTDALANGFAVVLLRDAARAVDVHPGDGERAIQEMIGRGAAALDYQTVAGA